jgi:hypothetical protein
MEIKCSPVFTIPPNKAKGIGRASVAVHPDFQMQGIGCNSFAKDRAFVQIRFPEHNAVEGMVKYALEFFLSSVCVSSFEIM